MTQNLSGILTSISSNVSQGKQSGIAFFKSILKESGAILSFTDDEPNILTQEQALVVRDIEKFLDRNELNSNIQQFLNGFKLLCKKEKYFKKALMQTQFKKSDDDNDMNMNISIQQESLIRIFLKVNHLQNEVIDTLIEEIIKISTEESEDTSWLRLLLSPLRYLPHINQPDKLTSKLLDILDVATFASQLEILDSIPEILPDSEYSETAKELTKLLDEKEELSAAIIDCLNALNLDTEIRVQIQDRILSKIITGTSMKIFPVLLEFLLTDYKSQNLVNIFHKIRNALDTIMVTNTENDKEKESGKILIFNRLQILTTTPKTVSDAWLTMILNIKTHNDHKPIDLLLLFMLHSTANLKKRPTENVIRKKAKDGLFKCSLVEKLFENYIPQQLLNDYFQSIIEISCSLLRNSQEFVIIEFASTLFKTLFNYKHTQVIYRQEVLDNLILLTGASDQKNVGVILKIFSDLLEDITKIQHHTVILMRLLEKLDTFHLADVKQVFEILCTLTCGEKADEAMSGLKDEIHMIVRKQLSSSKRNIKYRGIISAVVMAKHIATTTEPDNEDDSFTDQSITSISSLPQGKPKEAASLLELTLTCTLGRPELMGLYYDQLAMMLMRPQQLNKYFMSWLYEIITCDFQNIFVVENVCDPINDLDFTMQYNLNSSEEIDAPIAINIGELTVKRNNSENNSILLLAPHFRLLRLLHYIKQNGDLSSIDALLGCSVILPNNDIMSHLDSVQIKQVTDCLFHCINWFREIISGFVTQKNKKLRFKIIQRLNNLIELEKLLNNCMENVPEHRLPICNFDTIPQISKLIVSPSKNDSKTKQPKKKLKPNETGDVTTASTSTFMPQLGKNTFRHKMLEYDINFREMDTDIILLLKYPNNLDKDLTDCTEEQSTINVQQLKFILKDFVTKLDMLTKRKGLGLSHLNNITPISIITDCKHIFPDINKHFNLINDKLNDLLKTSDGCYDIPELLTDEVTDIKICFGLILETWSLVFSWSDFHYSKRLDLLRDLLKALRSDDSQTLNSANRLIIDFINRFSNYIDQCLHISHAVNLIKIMQSLNAIVSNSEIEKKMVTTSEKLLQKRWYNLKGSLDSGKEYLANIDIIIKAYLNGANIKTICGLVGTLQEEQRLKGKEDHLQMLISISKSSFTIFYRNLWNVLHSQIKAEIRSLTNNEHLILWRTTALTMQGLMTVAKTQEIKSNFYYFMKKSIDILKIFLSQGIPILEIMLRSKPDEVVEIFKIIQTTTRFLHHLCCQSKLTKDSSLVAYVPQFRLTLETLVYRVKAALVANNCSAAFWMGNLRNKDLQGEDIISQSTTTSEDTGNVNSDEELPPDEDDSDSDILSHESTNKHTSESEVFD